MSCQRPLPSWSHPPQHEWSLDEIKMGNIISTHSLNKIIQQQQNKSDSGCCVTFGRISDDPSLVDIVTAHESCSRVHARIAFDNNGTPWLRDLGSGNGTFVNEKRLPPEACGKEDNRSNSNRKGSRGVVLYPGDAIRFGASTRLYILEGPEEFERGAIKLKQKMKAEASNAKILASNDEEATKQNEEVCGWGMADDVVDTAEETEQQRARVDQSNSAPLPSIESFFYSDGKYKIPNPLHQLHSTYNTKMNKLQSIQKESSRIMQKENMGVELSDGQRGQLAKNAEKISALEKDIENLKNRIEDGMHNVIYGGERSKKRQTREDKRHDEDDDVDDFYDRTASSSKKQRTDDTEAESEEDLIMRWKILLEERVKQQRVEERAFERCTALQRQIDNSNEDDEDSFFLQNDLTLAKENFDKAAKSVKETDNELDNVEYLLKIVNPKLVWDRKEGLIGTNVEKIRELVLASAEKNDTQSNTESDSIMMPPPPPPSVSTTTTSESFDMPPPPPMAVQVRGPMGPPPNSHDNSMPPPDIKKRDPEPEPEPQQRKKQHIGPKRPPANIQGTLAALTQASSMSATNPSAKPNTNNDHSQTKKTQVVSNLKEDVWKAPVDQDGSGRTALNDKFKGRY